MKGSAANTQMRHRLDESGDPDATRNLRNGSGPLSHFSDDIGRKSGLITTANQLIIEDRIRFARRQYPAFVLSRSRRISAARQPVTWRQNQPDLHLQSL